jgi:hypothetical protein
MSKENVQKEEYELAEIFSSGQINKKKSKGLFGLWTDYCMLSLEEHSVRICLEVLLRLSG